MNNLMTVHTLGPKLIEALGAPKHCTWIELRLAFGEIPTVTCEYYPVGDDGTIDLAAKVLAEYELVPRATPAAVELHPAEGVGFDVWMRERTEAVHQAMMKHARRGGIPYT
ncbi:hypothetical protein ACQ4WP_28735 [Janthinobacterium sp. GB4P2]|uniref:hypothetical protein n=1 Tax=Janthinobacterium sp. GB4P2 TaxID=3424189 RepID=UPI003F2750E6